MTNKQDENLLDHDYDGIREQDNPMPMWWLWSFFLAIIFGFIYFLHYTTGAGPTLLGEFEKQMAQHNSQYKAKESQKPKLSDNELHAKIIALQDSDIGKKAYEKVCQACHGDQMQGLIGPNLVDNHWIHGKGTFQGMMDVIQNGVLDKGMPAWKDTLKGDELYAVVAFIYSKRGVTPKNAKAPQGDLIEAYTK